MKKVYTICLLIVLSGYLFAQKQESTEEPTIELLDKLFLVNQPALTSSLKFPIVEIGMGILNFHGDIKNTIPSNFAIGTPGVHVEILQAISPSYSIGLRFLRGSLTDNYYPTKSNIGFNFKTQITSFGAQIQYNFGDNKLPNSTNKIFTPYASLGIEVLQRAEAWGDLYSDSTQYYIWSDGTLRDIKQSKYNTSKSKILYRDYTYETSYERENFDNIPYFNPLTVGLPLEFGFLFNITSQARLKFGYQYHLLLSNTIDNISQKGTTYSENPERYGKHNPDGFSYAYIALTVNLNAKDVKMFGADTTLPSSFLDFWDADNDGIDETEDECPYTPEGVKVFANGCPLDDDRDNIPNYKDKELNTRAFFADENGFGKSEKEVLARIKEVKIVEQKEIYRFYPKLLNGGTIYKQFYKKIPWKYKVLDSDKNEYIDIDEMLHAIDTFFDEGPNAGVGANLAVKDLFELIEFFFLQ